MLTIAHTNTCTHIHARTHTRTRAHTHTYTHTHDGYADRWRGELCKTPSCVATPVAGRATCLPATSGTWLPFAILYTLFGASDDEVLHCCRLQKECG
jgi:hypothetical protein